MEVGDFSPLSPLPKGWLSALVPAAPAPDSRKWILKLCELLGIGGRGGKRPMTRYPSHVPVRCPTSCPLPWPPAAPAQLSTRVVVPVTNIRVRGVGREIVCAASLVAAGVGGAASSPPPPAARVWPLPLQGCVLLPCADGPHFAICSSADGPLVALTSWLPWTCRCEPAGTGFCLNTCFHGGPADSPLRKELPRGLFQLRFEPTGGH